MRYIIFLLAFLIVSSPLGAATGSQRPPLDVVIPKYSVSDAGLKEALVQLQADVQEVAAGRKLEVVLELPADHPMDKRVTFQAMTMSVGRILLTLGPELGVEFDYAQGRVVVRSPQGKKRSALQRYMETIEAGGEIKTDTVKGFVDSLNMLWNLQDYARMKQVIEARLKETKNTDLAALLAANVFYLSDQNRDAAAAQPVLQQAKAAQKRIDWKRDDRLRQMYEQVVGFLQKPKRVEGFLILEWEELQQIGADSFPLDGLLLELGGLQYGG